MARSLLISRSCPRHYVRLNLILVPFLGHVHSTRKTNNHCWPGHHIESSFSEQTAVIMPDLPSDFSHLFAQRSTGLHRAWRDFLLTGPR